MGQGYSLTSLSAGSAGIDVPELADLTYERSLGTARFMKSIRARHRDGLAFVKVIMKPYPSLKLDPYVRAIMRMFREQIFRDIFNVQYILTVPNIQASGGCWKASLMRLDTSGYWKLALEATLSGSISTAHSMIE